jgi:hypothetical protein
MNHDQLARDYAPRNPYSDPWLNATQPKEEYYRGQEQAIRGALGPSVEKQRQHGNVTREVQQLEKNLHALASVIDSLDIRLAAACLPIPETAAGLRTSDGGGCPLANQLAAFNTMLSTQTSRIEMIYQGVDL